jgi:hypothetical protein
MAFLSFQSTGAHRYRRFEAGLHPHKANGVKDRMSYVNIIRLIFQPFIGILIAGLLLNPVDGLAAGKVPLSRADFSAHHGENFSVYGGKGLRKVVSLKLIEVAKPREDNKTVEFSVRFQGPGDYPLDKAVYTFERADTGAFTLFLEPTGADSNGRYYRALFNLLK